MTTRPSKHFRSLIWFIPPAVSTVACVALFVCIEHLHINPGEGSLARLWIMTIMFFVSLPGILAIGYPLSGVHYAWAVGINILVWGAASLFFGVVLETILRVTVRRNSCAPGRNRHGLE